MTYPLLPADTAGTPVNTIWIPGTGWVAIQGGTPTTDGGGVISVPLMSTLVDDAGVYKVKIDAAGNLQVNLATYIAGEDPVNNVMDVESAYGYFPNISTNSTTSSKASPGYLKRLVINNPGSNALITVYDNTTATGTIIAIIKPSAPIALDYEVNFTTGLTIVTTGTIAANITPVGR